MVRIQVASTSTCLLREQFELLLLKANVGIIHISRYLIVYAFNSEAICDKLYLTKKILQTG